MADDKCPKCEGCGKVATDEDQSPWTYWLELPLQSSLAVLSGIVKPVDCPECGGTGKRKEKENGKETQKRTPDYTKEEKEET